MKERKKERKKEWKKEGRGGKIKKRKIKWNKVDEVKEHDLSMRKN